MYRNFTDDSETYDLITFYLWFWNLWFDQLLLWFYEVLRVILVSHKFQLYLLHSKELFTQFAVFYINLYFIISEKTKFQKSKD